RRARIALAKAKIGVDHAHERKARKVMALGDELRSDHNVDLSLGDGFKLRLHALDAAGKIAGKNENARVREQPARFFFEPLDAGADGGEGIRRLAFRAGFRRRRFVSAMMTGEPLLEAVLDEPRI